MYLRKHRGLLEAMLVLIAVMLGGCQALTQPGIANYKNSLDISLDDPIGSDKQFKLPNLLVKADGQVAVRRLGRSERSIPIGVGAELQVGDLVEATGGTAAVFCGDETQWSQNPKGITPGVARGVPCIAGHTSRPKPDLSWLRQARSASLAEGIKMPYVIRPRTGFVLEDRPRLEWYAPGDSDTFTVTLIGPGNSVFTTIVTGTNAIDYPSEWPALERNGSDYELRIEAGGQTPGLAETHKAGFTLLSGDLSHRLELQEARLRERPIDELGLTILTAELYLHDDYRLRSNAIDILRESDRHNEVQGIQYLLGETYLAMGLFDLAEPTLLRALELAQIAGLSELEADTEFGLGFASCALWRASEAEKHFARARLLYEALAFTEQVKDTEMWLSRIEDGECSLSDTRVSAAPTKTN